MGDLAVDGDRITAMGTDVGEGRREIDARGRLVTHGHVAIAAKEESYSAYNDAMNKALPNTVWITGGCTSWYVDKSGLPNLYPWAPERYLKDMRRPDFSEFHLLGRVEAVASS